MQRWAAAHMPPEYRNEPKAEEEKPDDKKVTDDKK